MDNNENMEEEDEEDNTQKVNPEENMQEELKGEK